jgi:hypothetical protein
VTVCVREKLLWFCRRQITVVLYEKNYPGSVGERRKITVVLYENITLVLYKKNYCGSVGEKLLWFCRR